MSRAADILLRLGDTNPIVPTSGQISFYAKDNGIFYSLDSNGIETPLFGGTGTVTSIDVSGGTTGLTTIGGPVTTNGTITLTGTLFETHGGTGVNTYITGDMLYSSATDTLSKLSIGANGQVLTVSGGVPVWSTVSGTGTVTSTSVVSANGFGGTVADSTTTPAITISTTVTGLVKGNGSAISAATGSDINTAFGSQTANHVYAAPNGLNGEPSFRAIVADDIPTLNQNTTGTANNVTGIVTETHGGTGTDTYITGDILYASAANTLSKRSIGAEGQVLTVSGGVPVWSSESGTGTVTSVAMTVPDFLSVTGSPITSSGTLAVSLSGTALPIANGGTGANTANLAFNALAPSQTGNAGKVLTTDGTDTSWTTISGTGSVTSVDVSGGTTGLTTTGGPVTSSGTITLAGTLAVANGGTGANTAPDARTNLGATTVGGNIFTLANPSAVTYLRVNADNSISTLDADSFRTAIGAGTSSTTGTVTSIDVSGGTTGLTTSGGPVTGSGIITLAGTLAITNGGTGANTAPNARTNLGATTVGSGFFTLTNPSAITFPRINADNSVSALDAATFRTAIGAGTSSTTGTVTSVSVSGGTTGLTTSGGPVTSSGTITLAGTLAIANGGTGATTANTAFNALAPVQTGNSGKFLTTDGANTSWATISATGTVTSVAMTVPAFLSVTGSPITSSGTLAVSLSGTALPLLNGGSGATTAAAARTNFGATTVGGNLFTLTNPSAVTYLRVNADNTVSTLDAASFRTAIGAGTSSTTGTVTSVSVSGGTTGLTTTGGPVTTSGTITLAGTLAIANGGTGATTANTAFNALAPSQTGNSGKFLTTDGTTTSWSTVSGTGTVTSIDVSGGTTGLTTTGGPVTGSGTITLSGTLALANGGTGATTQSGAANAILPTQTGNSGKVLTTDGSTVSWTTVSGSGTVTSVSATGNNGITVSGSPITTSGTITIGLDNITPINVAATGTVTGTNLSGTNTGDQTITLTGDVTGTGTGSFATTLANTSVTAGVYGSSTEVPVITVDSKGRITNVSNTAISGSGSSAPEVIVWHYSSGGSGNFSAVDALYSATSGVTPTIIDAANCIATYSFSGKSNLPKSMTIYGQVYSTNSFQIKTTTSLPSASVVGGGTAATPALISGAFSASNLVTLQTRMSDVGASAGLGQRAWLIVVFGF